MTTELLIWLIPLPPVLAFFLIVLFTNRSKALSHTMGVGAAFLSFLAAMVVFFRALGVESTWANIPFESRSTGCRQAIPG
jgi:NADH:ubiquinone oxidoreductase subunit 5 (subunit L)/multisubunit Na+/H+ antiporter MnhA subunit